MLSTIHVVFTLLLKFRLKGKSIVQRILSCHLFVLQTISNTSHVQFMSVRKKKQEIK